MLSKTIWLSSLHLHFDNLKIRIVYEKKERQLWIVILNGSEPIWLIDMKIIYVTSTGQCFVIYNTYYITERELGPIVIKNYHEQIYYSETSL